MSISLPCDGLGGEAGSGVLCMTLVGEEARSPMDDPRPVRTSPSSLRLASDLLGAGGWLVVN